MRYRSDSNRFHLAIVAKTAALVPPTFLTLVDALSCETEDMLVMTHGIKTMLSHYARDLRRRNRTRRLPFDPATRATEAKLLAICNS
jgi:hypothetical protein